MSPISREEIAVILVNFGNYLKIDIPAGTAGEMPFGDGNLISPEALPSVIIMNQAGILTGRPGNLFDPKGYTTRGEIAVIFKRFITVFFRASDQ